MSSRSTAIGTNCSRAICSSCNNDVRLRKSGRFFVHGPLEARCQMSDKSPSQLPPSGQAIVVQAQNQPTISSESLLSDVRLVRGRILRFVPRGARVQWTYTITHCLDRILKDPDAWSSVQLATALRTGPPGALGMWQTLGLVFT